LACVLDAFVSFRLGMSLKPEDYEALANFRYAMRKFLRFSKDNLAAQAKLTPEQYEALLAIKSPAGSKGLTVGEVSERLQVRHHTAVSLLDRLAIRKLIVRRRATADRRVVLVNLTPSGNSILERVALVHRGEMRKRSAEMIAALKRLQK
jgi:DNA-binding MarR family transcriptional regulator